MNLQRRSWAILLAVVGLALFLASCDGGTMEKGGRALDRAGEKVGDGVRGLTK